MVRMFVAAQPNHQITNGTVSPGRAKQLKRRGDPVEILEDGVSGGNEIENTVFDPVTKVSSPGATRADWLHPDTGEEMSVSPLWFIIEGDPIPRNDAAIANFQNPELGVGARGEPTLIQKRSHELVFTGTAPNTLTPPELATLLATHRLRLVRGRFLVVVQLRS